MKNKIKIETILNQIFDNELALPTEMRTKLTTTFSATIDNESVTQVFPYNVLTDELGKYDFMELVFYSNDTDYVLPVGIDLTALYRFCNLFQKFKETYIEQYNRVFMATMIKYNPLENYEKHGNVVTTRTGTEDTAHTGTIGTDGSVTTPTLTNTNAVTTEESTETFNDTDRLTLGGGKTENENTTTLNNNDTLTLNTSETVTDTTHGNIGTMTFDKMGGGEYEWRKLRLFSDLVKEFVYKYGVYCKGVENEQTDGLYHGGVTHWS